MLILEKNLNLNLKMFDEGGQGAPSGDAPSGSESLDFENVVSNEKSEDDGAEAKKNAITKKTPEQLRKEYNELIKGEYKDIHNEIFQERLDKRFKKTKELEATISKHNELIDLLKDRYGASTLSELIKLVDDDSHLLEDEAYEKGLSVEQLKEMKRLKAKAQREQDMRIKLEQENESERFYRDLVMQSYQVKEKYPEFDLSVELNNPKFNQLLESGVPMEHAYNVIHMDDIITSAVDKAMKLSSKATAETISKRGQRPKENALGKNSAVIHMTDVSKLTKDQREEIARRVGRGEIISF